MNRRLIAVVFLTSFLAAAFCLGKAVFATATPNQCSPVLNGMGAVEIEKPLSALQINTDQPIEILNLFQGRDENWKITEIENAFEISINNKETSLTGYVTKWQLSKDNFEINFSLEIANLETSNKNLEIIARQITGKELSGSIITDKDSNLYLAIESHDKYFPPIQRSLRQITTQGIALYIPSGDRICLCCNNGGTGCSTVQCNNGSPCGRDETMGAFCQWTSRSTAGNINAFTFGISFCIAFLSGYKLKTWR